MVAAADNYSAASARTADDFYRVIRSRAFYLHAFLIKGTNCKSPL